MLVNQTSGGPSPSCGMKCYDILLVMCDDFQAVIKMNRLLCQSLPCKPKQCWPLSTLMLDAKVVKKIYVVTLTGIVTAIQCVS